MGDSMRWLWVGLLPLACTFDTAGVGGDAPVVDSDTEASSGADGSPDPSNSTSGVQSGSGEASTGDPGTTSESPDDPTTGDDPTDAVTPRARLVFVDPNPIDLGTHPLSGPDVLTLQLTNEGEAAASILGAGQEPPSPLLWAGATFPGTDGTCQGLIPPGGTCTVTLAVGPGQPGLVGGDVEVRFDDRVGVGKATGRVQAIATGAGPNLVENPDAESDPPGAIMTGWDADGSSFHTNGDHNHGSGALAFFAGGSESPEMTQDVVLSPWADSIDTLAMQFHFTGWTRSRDAFWQDDPHGLQVLFLDASGQVLDSRDRGGMTHDGWEQTTFDAPLPVGARRVRIRLTCDRNDNLPSNDNCSAYFDDFFGGLVLPAG